MKAQNGKDFRKGADSRLSSDEVSNGESGDTNISRRCSSSAQAVIGRRCGETALRHFALRGYRLKYPKLKSAIATCLEGDQPVSLRLYSLGDKFATRLGLTSIASCPRSASCDLSIAKA